MSDSARTPTAQYPTSMSSFPSSAAEVNSMSDLRQTLSQLNAAANPSTYQGSAAYSKNVSNWYSTPTQQLKNPAAGGRSTRTRNTRPSNLSAAPVTNTTPIMQVQMPIYQTPAPVIPVIPAAPVAPANPPRPPLPTIPQALQSTYSSRMKTGVSLLVQPNIASTSATNNRAATRRGGMINYADPGSGDDIPDAGALDSDDSDFLASGGTRTAIRQSRGGRMANGMNVFNAATGASTPRPGATPRPEKAELEQSYLGMVPPQRFIKPRIMYPVPQEYIPPDVMESNANLRSSLIPIRVEFETDTHRIRDCFTWNVNETLLKPETFAKIFCNDLEIPQQWAETVAAQIRAQLEDNEGVASMDLGQDGALDIDAEPPYGEEIPECRVILSIDVQIANHHLMDHIEWDLLSPLTPEAFSAKLCSELGLTGEAMPLIAHAIHEEILKHKKDAIEWGVIGGERDIAVVGGAGDDLAQEKRDRSGFGLVKDKTGLGLSWGRAPRDGRGPKTLKSVWRDWQEAEEFRTTFEELTAEEVERRELERERATRRLRRETSKFQTSTRTRRR